MNHKFSNCILALGLIVLTSYAMALPEDREKPITGRSDEKTIDTATGIVSLLGNVFITQGNLEIYADDTTIETSQDSNQLKQLIANGEPARFIDLPSATGDKVEVSGFKIEFHPEQNLIITSGDAEINQNGNIVHGERIEYNTVTGLMDIHSLRSVTGNPDDAQAELTIIPGVSN